jgi:DivIVA domain-containing protein
MPLTPADVRTKQFTTTRLRSGYDEEEVDAFLDEVEAELDRLIQENEELRAKLAESLRGGKAPALVLSSPLAAPLAESLEPPQPAAPLPEGNVDKAARILALAQQTADQAIAEAGREAEETRSQARQEADETLGSARRQAEQITSEARGRAEHLERVCQERHLQAMGSLGQQREEIEQQVADLRAFERERRSELRAFAERLLRDLDESGDGAPVLPTEAAGSRLVPAGSAQPRPSNGDQTPADGT